jgi:hypothetical protein
MDRSSIFGLAMFVLPFMALPAHAAVYYVSPTGNDSNSGIEPSKPWRTIDQLNRTTFRPGDRILFQGGATFNGMLQLDASDRGTTIAPIVIASYGTGRATINAGSNSGIFIYNSAGYRIENLKIQGSSSSNRNASGIVFYSDLSNGAKLDYIRVTDVEAFGFEAAGISIGSWHPSKPGFRDVHIVRANVYNNRDAGIIIYGYFDSRSTSYSHQNVYIARSKAHNNLGVPNKGTNSGSGIVVGDTSDATIEYNEAFDNGRLNNFAKGGPVGIWAWDATRVKIQYNKSYRNRSQTFDGGGFDLDGGMTDSIMQYNYSNDNDGAGYLLAQFADARPSRNNTVRYNVSHNDGRHPMGNHGGIHLWNAGSGSFGNRIYNNTIVLGAGLPSTAKGIFIDGPNIQAGIYNNILMTTGNVALVTVTQPQSTMQFQGNFYWATDSNFRINWGSQSYRGFTDWQSASRQEFLQGRVVGKHLDPKLNTSNLPVLFSNSPAINAGLNLNQLYGISVGGQDYMQQGTPRRGAYDVGAYELP